MIGKLVLALAVATALLAGPALAKPPFKFPRHAFVDGDIIILQCEILPPQMAAPNYRVISDIRSAGAGTPTDPEPNPIDCAQLLSDLILEGFSIDETLGDTAQQYYRLIR